MIRFPLIRKIVSVLTVCVLVALSVIPCFADSVKSKLDIISDDLVLIDGYWFNPDPVVVRWGFKGLRSSSIPNVSDSDYIAVRNPDESNILGLNVWGSTAGRGYSIIQDAVNSRILINGTPTANYGSSVIVTVPVSFSGIYVTTSGDFNVRVDGRDGNGGRFVQKVSGSNLKNRYVTGSADSGYQSRSFQLAFYTQSGVTYNYSPFSYSVSVVSTPTYIPYYIKQPYIGGTVYRIKDLFDFGIANAAATADVVIHTPILLIAVLLGIALIAISLFQRFRGNR